MREMEGPQAVWAAAGNLFKRGVKKMKRNSKRFLSLCLSVPLAFSLAAVPVNANPQQNTDDSAAAVEESTIQDTQNSTTESGNATVEEPESQETGTEAEQPSQENPAENPEENSAENLEEDPAENPEENPAENPEENPAESIVINIQDALTTFTINAADIEAPEINVNEMQLSEEELEQVDETDPEIAVIKEELEDVKVLNADGESVPLTEEQIQEVLGMFNKYQQQWQANANILGVQSPFYLMFNDNGEDGLGALGEMLTLAGVSVEDVRNGNYSYDNLTGMIMNFLYGDMYGIQFYGEEIRAKRDEALAAVEASGAQTDVQKIMALNTWLSQHNTFDMSYIMNQMGDEPIMTAENPQQHEYYDEIYSGLAEVYRPQIEAQFQGQFREIAQQQVGLAVYQSAIQEIIKQQALSAGASEEEAAAQAEAYMTENAEAIAADPRAYIVENLGGEDVAVQIDEQVNGFLASEEGQAAVEQAYTTIMDTQIPDLGNMTPNQAIEVYVDQAAAGLTDGIIGYWEGNHIGALADGKSVCMGYAKAFAYLMQCMYPEIYLKDGATDINDSANWKTASELYFDENGELDIDKNYNVDLVRITFQASVSMYGEPQPDFNSDHFWNAVKVDGKWYYVDPCYTDVFSEVMNRDRVETDGYMNHTYFMISHSSLAEMFDGNYKEIKTLYADTTGSTVNADYTSSDYENSWVTRVVSNVYSDGTYMYYMYDSTDMLGMLREFNNSQGNYGDMDIEDAVYKIVRHQMDADDKGDGDTDYQALIDFNSGDSVTVYNPSTGEMETNEMLTELYAQFVEEQSVYPAIHITPVLSGNKLYFNLSNKILSYDLSTGAVAEVKEYNTVNAVRDDTEIFGAMAFDVTDSAEGADFTFENHPIAGMTLKDDGMLYVDIATNLSYIAGKDVHNYMDTSSYGYEYEESNYNPNYNEFSQQMMEDQGISDDMLESLGYKREINDNSEFMWVANAVETLDMAHFTGDSHSYAEVTVAPFCGRDGYTENRCSTCGAVEAGSRTVNEGSALEGHHYVLFNEEYYTKNESDSWNTGEAYVCTKCGFHISEPTEPKENSYVTGEDYEQLVAEYEKNKEIYDNAVATAGHTYTADDAQWNEDYTTVTFQNLSCSAGCVDRKNVLDCLLNDETVTKTLTSQVTANAVLEKVEGTCEEGVTSTYSATAEVDEETYTITTQQTWEPGEHNYVDGKCTKCGTLDPDAIVAPLIESVYSTVQDSAKVTWNEVANAYGYELWRAESADASDDQWTRVKTVYSGENSNIQYAKDEDGEIRTDENGANYIYYRNVGLDVGTTYYYKVRSFTLQTGTEFSTEDDTNRVYSPFSEVKYMPSAVVLGDVYSAATNKIRLNWTEVSGAHGYQIWRLDDADGEYKVVKTLGDQGNTLTNPQGQTTAYSNIDLAAGKTYTYKMRAFSIPADGTKVFGAYSDEITVAVMPETTEITVESVKAGRADISWEAVSGAAGYEILMKEGDGDYNVVKTVTDPEAVSYTKFELESGTDYTFKVRAYTQGGYLKGEIVNTFGAYSNEETVTVK